MENVTTRTQVENDWTSFILNYNPNIIERRPRDEIKFQDINVLSSRFYPVEFKPEQELLESKPIGIDSLNYFLDSMQEEFYSESLDLPPKRARWKQNKFDNEYVHYPWPITYFYFYNDLWLPCSHPRTIINSLLFIRCENEKCQALTRNICDGWNIPLQAQKNYSNPCIYRPR